MNYGSIKNQFIFSIATGYVILSVPFCYAETSTSTMVVPKINEVAQLVDENKFKEASELMNEDYSDDYTIADINQLLDDRNYADAGYFIDEGLSAEPDNRELHLLSAIRYSKQKNWDQFFAEAETTLKLNSESVADDARIRERINEEFQTVYDEAIGSARGGPV